MNLDKQLLGPASREHLQLPAGRTHLSHNGKPREMTLPEWVATLPPGHRARQELGTLQAGLHAAQVRTSIMAFALVLVLIATITFLTIRANS